MMSCWNRSRVGREVPGREREADLGGGRTVEIFVHLLECGGFVTAPGRAVGGREVGVAAWLQEGGSQGELGFRTGGREACQG